MSKVAVFKNISHSDIEYLGWDGTENQLMEMLYKLGCDITKPIEKANVIHRNLRNQVVEGLYYICHERLDRAYIKSGHASIEAIYASTGDNSLVKDLTQMSKRMTHDTTFGLPPSLVVRDDGQRFGNTSVASVE